MEITHSLDASHQGGDAKRLGAGRKAERYGHRTRTWLTILLLSHLLISSACTLNPLASSQEHGHLAVGANPIPSVTLAPSPPATAQPGKTATPARPTATLLAAKTPSPSMIGARTLPLAPVADREDSNLKRVLLETIGDQQGSFGVAVKHLITGQTAEIDADREFMSASLFKLSVMYEAFQQQIDGSLHFTETITVSEEAAAYDSGTLKFAVGDSLTIEEAMRNMITISDNTMGVLLLDRVKSWNMNATMEKIGLLHTRVTLDDQVTSPADMLHLLELIATGRAVSPISSERMLALLREQRINDRLPHYLPKGTVVAHKTGEWVGIRHDVGIVFSPSGPYAIAVLSDGLDDLAKGSEIIARLSANVYDYFSPG